MAKVTGIGGVFFKVEDPERTKAWYREHLGIEADQYGATFEWREKDDASKEGMTVWNPFPASTTYFDPSKARFMVNYRVDDLLALLDQLRAAGVTVDDKIEDGEFGKFGWAIDPDGNRLELWEPPKKTKS